MTQKELRDLLKAALRRGDTLDAEIPLYIRKSVEFIERNHKLTYMDKFGMFSIASSQSIIDGGITDKSEAYWKAVGDARTITLPSKIRQLKAVKRVREVDGERTEIGLVDRQQHYEAYTDDPSLIQPNPTQANSLGIVSERFYTDGLRTLIFSSIPADETAHYHIAWEGYTIWSDADDYQHPLLENAGSLLFAQTMLGFAPRLSMPHVRYLQYQNDAVLELKALLNADQDYRYTLPARLDPDIYVNNNYVGVNVYQQTSFGVQNIDSEVNI